MKDDSFFGGFIAGMFSTIIIFIGVSVISITRPDDGDKLLSESTSLLHRSRIALLKNGWSKEQVDSRINTELDKVLSKEISIGSESR